MLSGSLPARDQGSFRDPSGHVFVSGDNVWRTVNPIAVERFRKVQESGLLEILGDRGLLIGTTITPVDEDQLKTFSGARGEIPEIVLKHPRIPFISHPYEWVFSQLQDAALAHLDLQITALDKGFSLSDATSYNMQYFKGKMLHIDVLSLQPYREGEVWAGYNQFCRLFLLPLLIEAWRGVSFQPFLRGQIDGIELAEAVRLLPFSKRWLSLNGLMHVSLQAKAEGRHSSAKHETIQKKQRLPKSRYRALLTEMRAWIEGLQSARRAPTFWGSYASINSYSDEMQQVKKRFIAAFIRTTGSKTIWDIGGNTGDYSVVALNEGAEHAIVLDSDLDSLEKAYARSKAGYSGLHPVVMDCVDPSPNMGWNQAERKGLLQRGGADAILALAVTHHMAIGRNIPLEAVIEWIVNLAPHGIIEFVPKSDPMVRQMLSMREDVFHDYDESHFRQYLSKFAIVRDEHRFQENGRLVVSYERRA